MLLRKNTVIQFNERHKWCGCFGVIEEFKKTGVGVRYLVGVPIPSNCCTARRLKLTPAL